MIAGIQIEYMVIVVIALAVTAMVIFLFVTFANQKNRIQSQRLKDQLEYSQKLLQSEQKALRGQMNPHFIHNSLNSIMYLINDGEIEKAEEYLTKFSRFVRRIFDNSSQAQLSLKDELKLITEYLEIEKLRFESKLNYKVEIEDDVILTEEYIPTMIIQPIVENAVNHGIFHKVEPGNILIKVFKRNNLLHIQIIDDGIGVKASEAYKIDNAKSKSRSSTSVIKERVGLLNSSNSNANIEYKIEDYSNNGTTSGTIVELKIKNNHASNTNR